MKLAQDNPHVIRDYLTTELHAGRIVGPFDPKQYPYIHTSRFGVIPKNTPGKWRLIVDLSSPEGRSVNDGIRGTWCSLIYVMGPTRPKGLQLTGEGPY